MEYVPPVNGNLADPDRSYINANPGISQEGSIPPAEAIEHPMREILYVIEQAGLTPDGGDLTQLHEAIMLILSSGGEVGRISAHAHTTVPTGELECNGAAISRTTYAALYAKIGTAFGAGNGTTTFNIPDLRGEFLRGFDNGRGIDSGRTFGAHQADELKNHLHTYQITNQNSMASDINLTGYFMVDINGGNTGPTSQSMNNSGGGAETRPRNQTAMYTIKY